MSRSVLDDAGGSKFRLHTAHVTENVVTLAGKALTDSFVGARYSIDTRQSTYGHDTVTYGSFFRDGTTSLAVSLDIVPRNRTLSEPQRGG